MSNAKEQKIENFKDLKKQIENILKDKDIPPLKKYINSREFETKVTKLASNTKFSDELISDAEEELKKQQDEYFSFTLFYTLFTWKRRNSHGSVISFYKKYRDKFSEFKIITHIKGMAILAESNQPKVLKETIDDIYDFINQPNSEFTTHVGVLNLYVELVCNYCELKFDERDCTEVKELLNQALEYIDNIIEQEEKVKKTAYQKFYLNKGRILTMLDNYESGEEFINKAISLIPLSQDRAILVNNYSQYLAKSSMIKAYYLTQKKLKELNDYQIQMNQNVDKISYTMRKKLERQKVDSYKIITLIMAVIGFLLGAISIFTKIEDTFTLLMVMVAYCGLMLFLVGIVLISFHFYMKSENKQDSANPKSDKNEKVSIRIAITVLICGVVLFVIPLTLTLLKLFNKI